MAHTSGPPARTKSQTRNNDFLCVASFAFFAEWSEVAMIDGMAMLV
jgi:hypothetical protein